MKKILNLEMFSCNDCPYFKKTRIYMDRNSVWHYVLICDNPNSPTEEDCNDNDFSEVLVDWFKNVCVLKEVQ